MAQQTAVELLHKESNELIAKYLDGKIDKRELITMHHNILYIHKEMEKEQIIDSYGIGHNDGCAYMTDGKTEFEGSEQYYNETYQK